VIATQSIQVSVVLCIHADLYLPTCSYGNDAIDVAKFSGLLAVQCFGIAFIQPQLNIVGVSQQDTLITWQ
jgi:hypothetical protein